METPPAPPPGPPPTIPPPPDGPPPNLAPPAGPPPGQPVKPIMFEHEMYDLTDGNMLKRKDPSAPQTIEEMESLLESLGTYVQVR